MADGVGGPAVNAEGTPTLSVVIPTRNRAAQVLRAVDVLLADPAVHEVVVVVDGSDDGTTAALEDRARQAPGLRPMWQPHAGAGAARQRGVEAAGGELVLLLDDDVVPRPGLASGHAEVHAAHDGPLVVVGAMPTPRPQRRGVDSVTTDLYVDDYAACTADWLRNPDTVLEHLWSGNLSLPRALAAEVGLDDLDMGALFFEDRDLGMRLRAAGVPAVYRPELAAEHQHARSLRAFLDDARRQGRGLVVLHQRYPALVPDPTGRWIAGRAPLPARWLVQAAARGGRPGRALPALVLSATRLAGRARVWRLQHLLAVLLRRVGQASGAAAARSGSVRG